MDVATTITRLLLKSGLKSWAQHFCHVGVQRPDVTGCERHIWPWSSMLAGDWQVKANKHILGHSSLWVTIRPKEPKSGCGFFFMDIYHKSFLFPARAVAPCWQVEKEIRFQAVACWLRPRGYVCLKKQYLLFGHFLLQQPWRLNRKERAGESTAVTLEPGLLHFFGLVVVTGELTWNPGKASLCVFTTVVIIWICLC